jgi:hypothetical protein
LDELTCEHVTAELAVGHDVDPRSLLESDHLVDRTILDRLELGTSQLAPLVVLARFEQVVRAKQAADAFRPERHCRSIVVSAREESRMTFADLSPRIGSRLREAEA